MDVTRYRQAEREFWETVGLSPTEQRIHLPCAGASVRVQVVGDGPPVLFVHGAPNAGSTWVPMLPKLQSFRCHLVDRPGTGLSDDFVLTDDPHAFARRFCGEVLDGLGIDRAHLVVSSFGGFLALFSAAEQPDRYERMVQMACPALVQGMVLPPLMRAMGLRPVRALMNALPPNERVGRQMLRQIGHGKSIERDRIPQGFFDWYLAVQRHTNTMRNDGEMLGAAITLRGARSELTIPGEVLGSVTTPTLFLWGEDDAYGGAEVARHVVGSMPHAELVMFNDAGHLPWLDDPEEIGERTATFLRSG